VVQDTDKWWAVVNLDMNLLFHKFSSLAEGIASLSQEHCAMELISVFIGVCYQNYQFCIFIQHSILPGMHS